MSATVVATTEQVFRARLGKRIRVLRRERGFSQCRLAALANIHVSHLSKVERGGANLTLSTLLSLALALNAAPSELLQDIPIPLSRSPDTKISIQTLHAPK